jgi:hypothetical protein
MENAKHIGGIWALAVALGMGIAVTNTPAVASAAPADSGNGSSSGGSSSSGSSPSSSSHDSGSMSSDAPSERTAVAATNDPASHHPHPLTSTSSTEAATTSATLDAPRWGHSPRKLGAHPPEGKGDDARRSGRVTSRPASDNTSINTSVKTSPNPLVVDVPTTDVTTRPSRLDAVRVVPAGRPSFAPAPPSTAATPVAATTAAPTSSSAAPAVGAPTPVSTVITPTPTDPLSRVVSTVINAVLSPFANSAPTAPVQSPAEWMLLAFARREFEPITNGGLVGGTSGGTSAADPDFISSTHNFGLFSTTSAADPDDNHYVAFVLTTPFFTNVLTSGADPEDNLGFGAASIGLPGHTVNTFISPFLTFSIAIPVTDPFAELFTELVRLGF